MSIDPMLQLAPMLTPRTELPNANASDAEAAKAFDELFARIMLQEVGKTLSQGSLFGGQQAQAFQSVWTDALATKIAEAGPGLGATWLENQGTGVAGTPHPLAHAPTPKPVTPRPVQSRPGPMRVSSAYGMRADPIHGGQKAHHGVDLAAPVGTEIPVPRSGTVKFAGDRGGYGNVVIVDHGDGVETRYAHCHTIKVKPGDEVVAGQVIATVGSTGRSTGPHLHLELRTHGVPTDPQNLIGEISKYLPDRSD